MAACGNKARSQSQPQKVPMKPPQTERGGPSALTCMRCSFESGQNAWLWPFHLKAINWSRMPSTVWTRFGSWIMTYIQVLGVHDKESRAHTTKDGNGFLNCEESVVWGRATGQPAELQVCGFNARASVTCMPEPGFVGDDRMWQEEYIELCKDLFSAIELCRLIAKSDRSDQPIANSSFFSVGSTHWVEGQARCYHQTLDTTWPYLQKQSGSGTHWTEHHTCRVLGSRESSPSFGKGSVVQFAVRIRKLVKLVMTWHNQQAKNCKWSFGHSFLCAYEAGLHGRLWACFCRWVMAHVTFIARSVDGSLARKCHVFCCRKIRCPKLRPYPGWDLGWLKQGWPFVLGVSVAVLTWTRVIIFLNIMFRSLDVTTSN